MRSARYVALTVVALATLAGCACPNEIALDAKWAPLKSIKGSATTPVGVYQTNGATCYTGSTCDFLSRTTVEQTALLIHESMHSAHQFAYPGGPEGFLARYNVDVEFLGREEMDAWAAEIAYTVTHGETVDPTAVAKAMAGLYFQGRSERNPGLNIFGQAETEVWIRGVIDKALWK